MKKSYSIFKIIVALLLMCIVTIQAQTKVSKWGSTPRTSSTNWTILNTATTPVGNASMGGTAVTNNWATILGGFDNTIQATTSQAAVVTGTFEFVGGGAGNAYTWLRYAFTYQDNSTLNNQNTPTAAWAAANHSGYAFNPRTGTGTIANGPYGQATLLTIPNAGGWNSSYAGGTSLGVVLQAPNNQVATAGIYDFAISVQPLSNGSNEIRWYFVQQHAAGSQNYYWWGGTAIDVNHISTKFNAIAFGVNNDLDATCKQINLANVTYSLGAPITVPAAPWQAFYITDWGKTPRDGANAGGWTILNDATYLIGDASMGGTAAPTAWTSIKGGFNPVTPTTAAPGKAMTVTGTFEFVGGGAGSAYTWLRFALFNGDGVLSGQNTPTASWTETSNGNGYIFTPVTGTGTISNTYNSWPSGSVGTEWPLINSKSWTSTNSNGGGPYSTILQAPARQVATVGVYDWAISVAPQSNGSNQVTWYFIQQHAAGSTNYYWWGGTFNDPTPVATTFNSIGFACNNDLDATTKRINIRNVKVDMGSAITIPDAPFSAYYLNTWGFIGGRTNGWTLTPGDVIGNVSISGKVAPFGFAAIRGGFYTPITATTSKALIVTGSIEFVGGSFDIIGGLRYGLFYSDKAGSVSNNAWNGTEGNQTGYLFLPPSGTNGLMTWVGSGTTKTGSYGAVVNAPWLFTDGTLSYPIGTDLQQPKNVVPTPGIYDFGISIQPKADGTNEIRQYLMKKDKTYYWAGTATDVKLPVAATKFNSVEFAYYANSSASTQSMNLTDIKVDLGTPFNVGATSVDSKETTSIPVEFALSQNYPNPFNPTTNIEFSLPKNSNVKLVVFDILGRVVAELVNGELNAGYHKVEFNAANLASGIYFYSIKAGDFASVKKLMLLK
jgi:hypothetical protein